MASEHLLHLLNQMIRHRRLVASLWVLSALVGCGRQTGPAAPPMPEPTELKPQTGDLYHRPHVTLVAVTDWQAVLKPCGCTVDLQKGGVERIAAFVDQLRKQDDSVLVVHAGSLFADPEAVKGARAAQLPARIQAFVDSLERLKVAAVAFSSYDVDVGSGAVRSVYESAKWPVLALGPGVRTAVKSTMIKTKSGVLVGILAVDPKTVEGEVAQQSAVGDEVVKLRSQRVQVIVVLSNLGLRASRKLARVVPGIDTMVVGQLDEKIEPPQDLEREGDTIIVHAARHGAWFSALTLAPGQVDHAWKDVSEFLPGVLDDLDKRITGMDKSLADIKARSTVANQKALPIIEAQLADLRKHRDQAVAAMQRTLPAGALAAFRAIGLPWSAPTDPEIAKIVADYDTKVARANVEAAGDVPEPEPGQSKYVGQAVCLTCHEPTKAYLAQDLHQHAWPGLEAVHKTMDLDCVSCHVTGFGQPGGSNLAHLEGLTNVQCESCHGPGSGHVNAPFKDKKAQIIGKPTQEVCLTCHTPEHAPRFHYVDYRKRLLVPGHGLPVQGKAP